MISELMDICEGEPIGRPSTPPTVAKGGTEPSMPCLRFELKFKLAEFINANHHTV